MLSASGPQPSPTDRLAALRIIDANFNRAAEGLRVAEEHCRFALGDRYLAECTKRLRHELTAALATLATEQLQAARETQTDVGTAISTPSESRRDSLVQIAAASWQRVEQALRAIEEYAKLVAPDISPRIERLRYDAYTLAKACTIAADSRDRLLHVRLYVLIDGRSSECEFVERAQALIEAGVHALQFRDKQLDDRTLLSRARLLRRVLDDNRIERERGRGGEGEQGKSLSLPLSPFPCLPLFLVNDRPDIAALARADGVHLGQEELGVHDARQIVGPDMLIGVSTHNMEQARQAVLDGANYLGCGPTFPSATKHFDNFPGLDFLRQVAAEITLPAFAIGGVTPDNLPQVLDTGITRVATGGAFSHDVDVPAMAAHFLGELHRRIIEQPPE